MAKIDWEKNLVTWKKLTRPHLQMAMVLGAGTMAEADPGGHVKERGG